MKNIVLIWVLLATATIVHSQTKQGDILSQERCKEITEYYCKQYIIEEVLQVQQQDPTGVYINAITAAKSGELTTVLYLSNKLQKKGVVLAFWNDFSTGIILPYKGYGFYSMTLDKANEFFNKVEGVVGLEHDILDESTGNLVYKFDDLTLLFYNKPGEFGPTVSVRVWWGEFDSEWSLKNLQTTIKRFRKYFGIEK